MSTTSVNICWMTFGLVGVLFILTRTEESQEKKPPEGVQTYKNSKRLRVETSKGPRKADFLFVTKRLILKQSGEMIVPILYVEQPKFSGANGGLELVMVWQQLEMVIDRDRPHLDLPFGDGIASYIILLQPLERPGAVGNEKWLIWEIPFKEAWQQAPPSAVIPSLSNLPLLDERSDKCALESRFENAQIYLSFLRQ